MWGTFLPAEEPTSDTEAPRGVSILARDMQSVAIYDARGQFVGIRRPDSGRPIEARRRLSLCIMLPRVLLTLGRLVEHVKSA